MKLFGKICCITAIVSLLLAIMFIAIWFSQPDGRIIVLFGMEDIFYIRILLILFLFSVAGLLMQVVRTKRRKIGKTAAIIGKTAAVIGMLLCMFLGVVYTCYMVTNIKDNRLHVAVVSEDGKRVIYRKSHTDLLGHTGSLFYIKSGYLIYDQFDITAEQIPKVKWTEDGFYYGKKFYKYYEE